MASSNPAQSEREDDPTAGVLAVLIAVAILGGAFMALVAVIA